MMKVEALLQERWVIVGLLGAILVGLGVFGVRYYDAERTEIEIIKSGEQGGAIVSGAPVGSGRMLVVEIAGAVFSPGVYRLPELSRTDDLMVVAGGMALEADRVWVEKNINRAARLQDGFKLYIPRRGEMEKIAGSGASTVRDVKRVGINSAQSATLETLEGVGSVIARRIVEGRPYARLEELVERKVVSQALFAKLRDRLSLE